MPATRYYKFDELRSAADCVEVAKSLGLDVNREKRCAAKWRGGDNQTSVLLDKNGWHDFGTGEGGDVIKLVQMVSNLDLQTAQEWLGDHLGIEPAKRLIKETRDRTEELHRQGYSLAVTYRYTDERGKLIHQVERWEHKERPKEFVQRAANGRPSVKDIQTVLYNLPEIARAKIVMVCEGEKDADNINAIAKGFVATTNASGAGRWHETYTEALRGRKIILVGDNDRAGEHRLEQLSWELREAATAIKVIRFPRETEGFDASDYIEKHGADKFLELVKTTPSLELDKIKEPNQADPAKQAAKDANKEPFKNYIEIQGEAEDGKKKTSMAPRHIVDLVKDVRTRLLGFPRRVGESIFDFDIDRKQIRWINNEFDLLMWIEEKTKKKVFFQYGLGFITPKQLYAGLLGISEEYQAISFCPNWPQRDKVFYAHDPLPKPSPEWKAFNKLMNFFSAASPADMALIRAMFAAPLYYEPGISRPAWIIDSRDGAGTGKTTMAEAVAHLYAAPPIKATAKQISKDPSEMYARILSPDARSRRVFLVDNIVGTFHCPEFADLITSGHITGRPKHGRNEVSRENDLTYIVTANSAIVDNDLAQRSIFIHVRRSDYSPIWKRNLVNFINQNRLQIIADIIDMLTVNPPFELPPATRFPEFEATILQQMCGDTNEYSDCIKNLIEAKAVANIEDEVAEIIKDIIECELQAIGVDPDKQVFIHGKAVEEWLKRESLPIPGNRGQLVKNLAKQRLLPICQKTTKANFTRGGKPTSMRGVLWNPDDKHPVAIKLAWNPRLTKVEWI